MLASVAYQSFIRNNTQLESIYRGVSPWIWVEITNNLNF
jgi:hypothetical protein